MPSGRPYNLDVAGIAVTLLQAEGVHPKVVQEQLGHANISVTMDIYSHLFPSLQEDATKRLDQFFAAG
jgi:integrase